MKILIATDAWHPQVNGVVTALEATKKFAPNDVEIEFLTPEGMVSLPNPFYPEVRFSLPGKWYVFDRIMDAGVDAIHIATEGPIGLAVRNFCVRYNVPFTTSFHTRYAEYLKKYCLLPRHLTWAGLRKFHAPSRAAMAATGSLASELYSRGFRNVKHVPLGVDTDLFQPRGSGKWLWPRPIYLSVGRVSKEKNLEAFLDLVLPGTKVVIGDGPDRQRLERRYPEAKFLGAQHGIELALYYSCADVFVFPSLTDTLGLVMLEALACGTPVAAFPVQAVHEVLNSTVGCIDFDLKLACISARHLSRAQCRDYALSKSWHNCAGLFADTVREAQK